MPAAAAARPAEIRSVCCGTAALRRSRGTPKVPNSMISISESSAPPAACSTCRCEELPRLLSCGAEASCCLLRFFAGSPGGPQCSSSETSTTALAAAAARFTAADSRGGFARTSIRVPRRQRDTFSSAASVEAAAGWASCPRLPEDAACCRISPAEGGFRRVGAGLRGVEAASAGGVVARPAAAEPVPGEAPPDPGARAC
mmetsp:Transcript_107434/g.321294  ORF Transcript_107434/g.321294 Transcript_107434/m.321294 type:complete len:200 (+) Transcript_107434:1062-1661(+)